MTPNQLSTEGAPEQPGPNSEPAGPLRPAGPLTHNLRAPSRRALWFGRGADAVVVLLLSGLLIVAGLRRLGTVRPLLLLMFEGMTPYGLSVSIGAGLIAGLRRRPVALVAAGLTFAVYAASVWPALGHHSLPPALASTCGAQRLRVAFTNAYAFNPTPEAAARTLLAQNADVVAVAELSGAVAANLDALSGSDYPYRRILGRMGHNASGLYSRVPFVVEGEASIVSGVRLRVIHTRTPLGPVGRRVWKEQLTQLRRDAARTSCPMLLVGDFNATRWHLPFGELLRRARLADAHEVMGRGLSRSWPRGTALGLFGPILRLDHALVNGGLRIDRLHDLRVPGSDHVGFVIEVSPQPPPPRQPRPA